MQGLRSTGEHFQRATFETVLVQPNVEFGCSRVSELKWTKGSFSRMRFSLYTESKGEAVEGDARPPSTFASGPVAALGLLASRALSSEQASLL